MGKLVAATFLDQLKAYFYSLHAIINIIDVK